MTTPLPFRAILILGPTASGKTALAHRLVDQFRAQGKKAACVNLDAFQIYKELNLGTAKATPTELAAYDYHGVDVCSLAENLDSQTFARLAWESCTKINAQGGIPICVGGSGLYLRAFLHGLDNLPQRDESVRKEIQSIAQEKGWPFCHAWLEQVDAKRASELHPNDKTRIERALEIFLTTGIPQSEGRTKKENLKDQHTLFPCFVIHCVQPKEISKERISKRVELLFEQGWEKEVSHLYAKYGEDLEKFHGFQAIGYREILAFVKETSPVDCENTKKTLRKTLVEKISTLTWHYAKKQLTWIAKEKCDFLAHPPLDEEELERQICEFFDF